MPLWNSVAFCMTHTHWYFMDSYCQSVMDMTNALNKVLNHHNVSQCRSINPLWIYCWIRNSDSEWIQYETMQVFIPLRQKKSNDQQFLERSLTQWQAQSLINALHDELMMDIYANKTHSPRTHIYLSMRQWLITLYT